MPMTAEIRDQLFETLNPKEQELARYHWHMWARDNQIPPESNWKYWVCMAGRGWGKTRTGAQWVRHLVEEKGLTRIALVAPTAADVRDIMVNGESGIIACSPPWNRPEYQSSKRRVVWPNGAQAFMYSSEKPNRLRGPQHEAAWVDELTSLLRPETWDMLEFGNRLGENPQTLVTTTPKVAHKLLKKILKSERAEVSRGGMNENRKNLAPSFVDDMIKKYAGTRLGRQEIDGEFMDKIEGALWSDDFLRMDPMKIPPGLIDNIIVSIDPSATDDEETSECGIVVVGVDQELNGYVLEDASGSMSPNAWGKKGIDCYRKWKASKIVAEINHGGQMVEAILRGIDKRIPFKAVHASQGKRIRAEPVSALYEQRRIFHVGVFDNLEDEMISFNPEDRIPADRVDALVWGFTELIVDQVEVRLRFI